MLLIKKHVFKDVEKKANHLEIFTRKIQKLECQTRMIGMT